MGDAIAGKLGSLVSQALEAEVAGMTATDPDLEKCRQLFEKYRQFVRLAGKAATAAASAPTGVNPIAVAQKVLADSAKEKLTRKAASAGRAGNFAEGALAAAAMKPGSHSKEICRGRRTRGAAKISNRNPGSGRALLQHLRAAARVLPVQEDRPERPLVPQRKHHHRQLLGVGAGTSALPKLPGDH